MNEGGFRAIYGIACCRIYDGMLRRFPSAHFFRIFDLLQPDIVHIINGRVSCCPVFPFQCGVEADGYYLIPLIFVYFQKAMVPLLIYQIDEMGTAGEIITLFGCGTVVCKSQVHIDYACAVAIRIDGKVDSVVFFPVPTIDVIGDTAISISCIVRIGRRTSGSFSGISRKR